LIASYLQSGGIPPVARDYLFPFSLATLRHNHSTHVSKSQFGTVEPQNRGDLFPRRLREHHVDSLTPPGLPDSTLGVSCEKKHYLLRSSGIKIESITEMAKDFSTSKIAILLIIEVRTRDTTLPLLRVAGSTPLGLRATGGGASHLGTSTYFLPAWGFFCGAPRT
jgi:hypothetical protein